MIPPPFWLWMKVATQLPIKPAILLSFSAGALRGGGKLSSVGIWQESVRDCWQVISYQVNLF